jgi:hypothetical protein
MNILLNYIYENFGEKALLQYLKDFTDAYHKPLHEQLKSGRLNVLAEYLNSKYEKEEWPVTIKYRDNYLEVEQKSCPGISYMRSKGVTPCPLYRETYNTVYNILCEDTPFEYVLEFFDEDTGCCKQIFKRKGLQ